MMSRKTLIAILTPLLLVFLVAVYLGQAGFWSQSSPPEKITISTSLTNVAGLLLIAHSKGFFSDNGLDVTLKILPSGNVGLEDLKAGTVEIAAFTEFVLASGTLDDQTCLKCLGAIAAADDIQVIARKDKGISSPGDLKGKRIGIFRGSNAEFFLGRFLIFNGLSTREVELVNLKPFAMAEALSEGQVDAVMVWEPAAYEIKKMGGDKIVSWSGQGDQPYYWLLVSTDRFIKTRPQVVERLFRGLAQAEEYIKSNHEENINILAAQVQLDPVMLKKIWPKYSYKLSFDQSLLIAMEDQARWMIKSRLSDKTQVPNYLDYIDAEALLKVDPKAVKLIIPGKEGPK